MARDGSCADSNSFHRLRFEVMTGRSTATTTILAGLVLTLFSFRAHAESPDAVLVQRLDALVTDAFPGKDGPGVTVLVSVDGKPVLRKAYGVSSLETHAKLAPDSIFRIG